MCGSITDLIADKYYFVRGYSNDGKLHCFINYFFIAEFIYVAVDKEFYASLLTTIEAAYKDGKTVEEIEQGLEDYIYKCGYHEMLTYDDGEGDPYGIYRFPS